MTTAALPIACTLGPGDYRERMAWIAALNRMALRDFTQDGRRLVLTYAPDAAELVRELVRREQDCCAFLTFTVQEDPEAVRLTVEAPAEAGESAAALFEPFTAPETAAAPTTAGITCDVECGCSGKFTGQPISKATSKATGAPAPAPKNRAAGVAAASGATAARWRPSRGSTRRPCGSRWQPWPGRWGWVAWQSARTGERPARATLYSMASATVVLALAYSWRFAEPHIIAAVKA